MRQALGTKSPTGARASSGPGLRAPSGCQVRPSVTNPRSIGDNNTEATGQTSLLPDRRGPRTRTGARAVSCPPLPYLRGPGGSLRAASGPPRPRGSATEAPRLAGAELGGGFTTSNSIGYRDSPVGGGGGRDGASSSSLRLRLLLLPSPSSPRRRTWRIPT